MRILLVEDNVTNQLVAKSMLIKLGYNVDAVGNGREALESLEAINYDLILMDCQMPIMDGYEATREIRNSESEVYNPSIPIIAMTANAMQGDMEKCVNAGMSDYVAKPVLVHVLAEKLEEWLHK